MGDWSRLIQHYNSNFLRIVDYCSKFPMLKPAKKLSADSIITCCKICRVWISQKDNVRHGYQFSFRKIQGLLQETGH